MRSAKAKHPGDNPQACVPATVTGKTDEGGWALLGLLLALGVLSIVMASAIVPNVKVAVQRDKEAEMIYRGERMARGIARYYIVSDKESSRLPGFQLNVPPPYGYLTELKKLREGVKLNVKEYKFVRASEMIDPMSSLEWEPVRARDPRIMKYLQAFAAETQMTIPMQYLDMAGPPQAFAKAKATEPEPSGDAKPPTPGAKPPKPPGSEPDPDQDADDDDDDADREDPLKSLFDSAGPGSTNIPIIGVAPRVKGKALRPLYGLERYEDWSFLYVRDISQLAPVRPIRPPGSQVSQ